MLYVKSLDPGGQSDVHSEIENFIVLVKEGLHDGQLPVLTLLDAKKYLELNINNKI